MEMNKQLEYYLNRQLNVEEQIKFGMNGLPVIDMEIPTFYGTKITDQSNFELKTTSDLFDKSEFVIGDKLRVVLFFEQDYTIPSVLKIEGVLLPLEINKKLKNNVYYIFEVLADNKLKVIETSLEPRDDYYYKYNSINIAIDTAFSYARKLLGYNIVLKHYQILGDSTLTIEENNALIDLKITAIKELGEIVSNIVYTYSDTDKTETGIYRILSVDFDLGWTKENIPSDMKEAISQFATYIYEYKGDLITTTSRTPTESSQMNDFAKNVFYKYQKQSFGAI